MIKVIPSADRHHVDAGWLDARWHFSFSDYHDETNMNWGPLRVFNDDVIQAGGGFGMHPHRDMEIITYVLEGELEHSDHLGHREVLRPGEVQVMSAGKGIVHAEANPSKTSPVHLLQLWIMPRKRGGEPRYEQRPFAPEARVNTLLPVVSSGDVANTIAIDQDATVYVSSLQPGQRLTHSAKPNRHAYLFVTKGQVVVNGQGVNVGDQLRAKNETELKIDAQGDAELILLDLP
ncbi:MAG: pirin family protein [Tepidisphaeraceae bacterium]